MAIEISQPTFESLFKFLMADLQPFLMQMEESTYKRRNQLIEELKMAYNKARKTSDADLPTLLTIISSEWKDPEENTTDNP